MNKESGYESPSEKTPTAASEDNSLEEEESKSFSFNDSYQATSTSFDSSVNPQGSTAGSSSFTMHTKEEGTKFRNVREKTYQILFPSYKTLGKLDCQSTGQETIYDMVKRRFESLNTKRYKPNFKGMLFMEDNCVYLNVGRPVGLLSNEGTYKCLFKTPTSHRPNCFSRLYSVKEYNDKWEMGHFFVDFENMHVKVSPLAGIIKTRVLVDFFKDETIFEALVRDERFILQGLRSCEATCDEGSRRLDLSYRAAGYQGKSIKISQLPRENTTLPTSVSPKPHPNTSVTTDEVQPSKLIKQEPRRDSAAVVPSNVAPLSSSTPLEKRKSSESGEGHSSGLLIEINKESNTFKVENEKELTKQLTNFGNFALDQGLKAYICELEDVTKIAKSVGIIGYLDYARYPQPAGTCFRIGPECIITNSHVWEKIIKESSQDYIFADFNFKKAGQLTDSRFIDSLVVKSDDLDYAIIKMKDPPEQLPPCIFSHGVSIRAPRNWSELRGMQLKLIGHPQGQPKQVDLMCAVDARPQSGLEWYVYALRRGETFVGEANKDYHDVKDQRRGFYQSSDFFHGSSGSPGIIFQNDKKWLVILHTRGFFDDKGKFLIEQGVMFSEIVKDVEKQKVKGGNDTLNNVSLQDLFPPISEWGEPMDTDQLANACKGLSLSS